MTTPNRPIIGVTPDTHTHKGAWRYEITRHYADHIHAAGGAAVILPYQVDAIPAYLRLCHGFMLGGGDDPDTRPFGEEVHQQARLVVPERQAFELALLDALDHAHHPVLGICLGMQWMALHHGGRLDQHIPDSPDCPEPIPQQHADTAHELLSEGPPTTYLPHRCRVFSHHHQAVADPGQMRIIARSDPASGSLIEAIDRPGDRFYLGVQWHPERTADPAGSTALFQQLVTAAREGRSHNPMHAPSPSPSTGASA